MKKRWTVTIGTATSLLLFGLAALFQAHNGPIQVQPMTDEEMGSLVGGDGCKDCRYAGARLDECYHAGTTDPCSTSKCIANYSIDYTCDLGDGTCNAYLDDGAYRAVQYLRQDSNCSTSHPQGITTWWTHYYGPDCDELEAQVRCEKNNGGCNGTLIGTSYRSPGILCN